MKLLGLNSPEIFIILVILLSILGPKRIEKGFLLFKKLLKFLLSNNDEQNIANSEVKAEEEVEGEVKEEKVDLEVKAEEEVEGEVKEETVEPEVKSIKPKKKIVKDVIIDEEVDSDNK